MTWRMRKEREKRTDSRRRRRNRLPAVRASVVRTGAMLALAAFLVPALPVSAAQKENSGTAEASEGWQKEKAYLLDALGELEDMGLSPIGIWSEISGNRAVMQQLDEMKESVSDAVNEKLQEAGDAASDAVEDAVQKETDRITEKVRKSLAQTIQEEIRSFLAELLP